MQIKYLTILLCLSGAVMAGRTPAAEQKIAEAQPQISVSKKDDPKSTAPKFNSVVVQSAKGKHNGKSTPFSLTIGKPITRAEDFLVPRWSPDGRYILLTKGKYHGLYLLSLAEQSIRTLSVASRIGYAARWSRDSRFIIINEADNRKVFDLTGKRVPSESISPKQANDTVFTKDDAVFIKDGNTGKVTDVSQVDGIFFMPQLSPDHKKVAYIGLSTGIHIRHLDSGRLFSIGLGTDIAWMPDSQGIIYTYSQDDGHRITASDLYYAAADGRMIVNLTNTPRIFESHPDIGKGLVYVVDGQVFLSEIVY